MASLFTNASFKQCHLLDAGAGIGSLSVAFLERWRSGELDFSSVELDAFEIDLTLHAYLKEILGSYSKNENFKFSIYVDDFVRLAVDSLSDNLFSEKLPEYTHAILNPPYRKIRNNSDYNLALKQVGFKTVNLYTAFLFLSLSLLKNQGQLVAIVPRSFCNGTYYRSFRKYILKRASLKHIHLFTARNKAFKDDDVLQENVILMMEKSAQQHNVTVTTSTDDGFEDLREQSYSFNQIVLPDHPDFYIHIPTSNKSTQYDRSDLFKYSLEELDITVSTGPVVDFRLKDYLCANYDFNTVPLLYPGHFKGYKINWPIHNFKKPNAIVRNSETKKWLFPIGYYCVVKRFSSKEEKRRIIARVVHPHDFPGTDMIGFENHLNIFHQNKNTLSKSLAYGLFTYLNTTVVDEYFRRYSGHTQVNANDLRLLKYPSKEELLKLGKWCIGCKEISQKIIDQKIELF